MDVGVFACLLESVGFWARDLDLDGVVEELEVERDSARISIGDQSVSSGLALEEGL